MKPLRKVLLAFFALLLVVLVFAYVFAKVKSKKGLPDYAENIQLRNLTAKVEVLRDEAGTPHIFAQNQDDLYRTTGFLMAQDRMWQMDLLRRVTLGRLSEILGKDFVDTDVLLRSLRFSKKSNEIWDALDGEPKQALLAFCDGVNQYIEQYKGNYPLEFFILGYEPEKWEPTQSINFIGYMAWNLKAGWNELVMDDLMAHLDSLHMKALLPHAEWRKQVVFGQENELLAHNRLLKLDKLDKMGLDVLKGSNNWAVSGEKSTSGMPIVANDMHLDYSVPGIWMQIHQVVDGELNVSGLILPGEPFPIIGHNDSIAWGMTNTYVDNLDYYEEKVNPENPEQYEYMGKWLPFIAQKERIKVGKDSVVEKEIKYSHRGPVVSEAKNIPDKVLTIHWVGDEPSNELLAIYNINRAHNWSDFRNAFKDFRSISQNIVYADKKGNIGLQACAGVPIRKRNHQGMVLPGWTDEYDWKGMVPFEELPFEFNPDRGYVSSANNKTVDSTYPYHIGSWHAQPYRIERIREMLQAKEKLSTDDFKAMQNDAKSTLAERIIQQCFSRIQEDMLSKKSQQAFKLIKGWDARIDKNLVAPTLCEYYQYFLIEAVFKDEMGEALFDKFAKNSHMYRIALFNLLENGAEIWIDNVNTEPVEGYGSIVTQAFENTVEYLANQLGNTPEKWKWGKIHTLTLKHPLSKVEVLDKIFNLNRGPYAVSGSYHTVAPYSYPLLQPSKVAHGASHRHIYALNNWDSTLSVIPTGNSGVPSSEFYNSQADMYIKGEYHNDYFSKPEITKNAKYAIEVVPKE